MTLTKKDLQSALVRQAKTITKDLHGHLERQLDRVEDQIGARIAGVDERVVGVDERVSGVETRLGAVDHRLAKVETSIVRLDKRVHGVEIKVDGLAKPLGAVEVKVDSVGQRVGGVETKIVALEARVDERTEELARIVQKGFNEQRDYLEEQLSSTVSMTQHVRLREHVDDVDRKVAKIAGATNVDL